MASVASTCEECDGKRFDASVLDYKLGGRDISEVLAMSVSGATEFFGAGEAKLPAAHEDPRAARGRGSRVPQPSASRSPRCPAANGSD